MTERLLVPDLGDFENVEVIEILVKEGQKIKKNDPTITIESDKSSVEVPSIFSGEIESIKVKVGDKVSKGDIILSISNSNQSLSSSKVIPKLSNSFKIGLYIEFTIGILTPFSFISLLRTINVAIATGNPTVLAIAVYV